MTYRNTAITLAGLGLLTCTSCISDPAPVPAHHERSFEPHRRQPPPVRYRKPPSETLSRRTPTPQPHHAAGRSDWIPPGGIISSRWTKIVIHHSATDSGSAALFDKEHRARGWDELGYHFVIGNGHGAGDGEVQVGPRWLKQKHGAHCKTPDNYYNDHGIGICLVGDFTKRGPTARQLASLRKLVEFLCDRCHIPPSGVTSHGAVTHRTACPGNRFPLLAFQRSLAASVSRGRVGAR